MSGDPIEAILERAQVLLELGRYDEVLALISQGLAQDPTDARLLATTSLALLNLGRNSDAASAAARAIAQDPDWEWPHRLRASALASEARKSSGTLARRLGQCAAESAREAVRLSPSDPFAYCMLADAELCAGNLRPAGGAARRAVELAPESVDTSITTSQVALEARDWLTAEAAARRALAIDPESYAALNNLGAALDGAGRRREAAAAFASAARQDPSAEDARRNVASSGLWVLRLGALLVLSPLLLRPATRALFWLATIASNVYISRRPARLAGLERWGIHAGLAFGRLRPPRAGAAVAVIAVLFGVIFGLLTAAVGWVAAAWIIASVLTPSVLLLAAIARGSSRRRRRAVSEPFLVPVKRIPRIRSSILVITAALTWLLAIPMIPLATSQSDAASAAVGCLVFFGLVAVVTTLTMIRRVRSD